MKIIILGAGQVGCNIARFLSMENQDDITIVDQSPELLKQVTERMDIQPILGFASDPDVLESAGAADADILVAVTGSDEINIVACEVANSLFKVKTKIARIRNQHYLNPDWSELFSQNHLAVDVTISPEVEIAKSIARSIEISGAFDVLSLLHDAAKFIGIRPKPSSSLIHTPIKMIPGIFSQFPVNPCVIAREGKIFIPRPEDQILPQDEVYCLVSTQNANKLMRAFGYSAQPERRVIIMGGGLIGLNLARQIEEQLPKIQVKIIEKNNNRAETIARRLHHSEVLCGDALDYDVLLEAGIAATETVVVVTQDDKVNILSSLLAKRQGANRALALLNNMGYASLVTSLGVDAIVDPRAVTVASIIQHTRKGRARSVHTLGEGRMEVIEAEAKESSGVIGLNVADISVAGQIYVPVIKRGSQLIEEPTKNVIKSGDRLVIIAAKSSVKKIEKLFALKPSYL